MSKLESPKTSPFDRTIPTGWLTAYGRTFSDIPFAQSIYTELEAIKRADGFGEIVETMQDTTVASRFEARHILQSKLIKQTGITQVLEVAAGLSTRGLVVTANKASRYVEFDLPAMIEDKCRVLSIMEAKGVVPHRPNLYFGAGSATERSDLVEASRYFDKSKPIVIADEGLLRYLSLEDKVAYAKNVQFLLEKFGGVWITSESLPVVSHKNRDITRGLRKRVSDTIGTNATNNVFAGEGDILQFFANLGFSIEAHSLLEVTNELTSSVRLNLSRDYVKAINSSAACFVLRVAAI